MVHGHARVHNTPWTALYPLYTARHCGTSVDKHTMASVTCTAAFPPLGQGHQQSNNRDQRNCTRYNRRQDSADQQYTANLIVAQCWFFSFGSYATKLRCCRWYNMLQLPKPKHQTSTRQLITTDTRHINPTVQYQNASSLVESWSVLVSSCQPSAI